MPNSLGFRGSWLAVGWMLSCAGCSDAARDAASICGDELCANDEDCSRCAEDCGSCPAGEGAEGWCLQVASGPRSEATLATAWSAAHAAVRYFGSISSAREGDDALVAALTSTGGELTEAALLAYGRALESVCYLGADDRPLGAASVTLRGTVAVVRPGHGELSLPAAATAVALDLRDLPDTPELELALERALAAVTASPLPMRTYRVQERTGFTDEAFSPQALYGVSLANLTPNNPTPSATVALPLAVLTSTRLPPRAAEWAALLRLSNRAVLLGADVAGAAAESRWFSTPTGGLAVRVREVRNATGRLPDRLPADADIDVGLDSLVSRWPPDAIPARGIARTGIELHDDFNDVREPAADLATVRAALLTAHGAVKLFFPYFGTLPDTTDLRLAEVLQDPAYGSDRISARQALRRFGNAIHDGHNWVIDEVAGPTHGLPVLFAPVADTLLVARSFTAQLAPGDTITAIDGVATATWRATEEARSYGATAGSRAFNASYELLNTDLPISFTVQNLDGTTRTESVAPRSSVSGDLYSGSTRAAGWLDDVGASDLYYINCDGRYVPNDAAWIGWLEEANTAQGLVLDMRGHPADGNANWDPYAFLQHLIGQSFATPQYRVPVRRGLEEQSEIHPYEGSFEPAPAPTYSGPVVLITDYRAVSFAEDFMMMLVGAGRTLHIVGTPSAGTTGSVTGMQLPGGFAFFLTGMEARWPDGHALFGEGVLPDRPVDWSAAELAAGSDPFINAAIAALRE